MRHHAKASTAGSTQRQATGLGRFFRGVDATRGSSLGTKGSSGPKAAPPAGLLTLATLILAMALLAAPASAASPTIAASWSEDVVFKEAILKAEINPEGISTSYHFEWGETPAYGNSTPEANIGSGSSAQEVGRSIEGLTPGTTYHYRLVATNTDGVTQGPDRTLATYELFAPQTSCSNQVFRIAFGAALPDCRAYEMVSPIDKNGGNIRQGGGQGGANIRAALNRASLDGEKITYTSVTAFGDALSSRNANQYIASRGDNGWSTHAINAPLGPVPTIPGTFQYDLEEQHKLFTPDLSATWVTDHNSIPLAPGAISNFPNLYRRDNITDTYEPLTTGPKPAVQPEGVEIAVEGHSSDFSHIVFSATAPLTPDAPTGFGFRNIYLYAGGVLHLVSVLPSGSPAAGYLGTGVQGQDDTRIGGNYKNAVSDDASRIFWTAGAERGSLFVRENPEQPQSTVNGSDECTEPGKACTRLLAEEATYITATPDGSKVLYTKGGTFSGFVQEGIESGEIFEADVDSGVATKIAGLSGGVLAASDDLSYIYFASREVLAPGATLDEQNIYVRHNGSVGFVTTVARWDVGTGPSAFVNNFGYKITDFYPLHKAVRLSGDGSVVAFQSIRSLTGYDNTDLGSGEPAVEVYVYDFNQDQLFCASCNPSGARPQAQIMEKPYRANLNQPTGLGATSPTWAAAWLQTELDTLNTSRPLSSDGTRLFFNAFDALVPRDTNGEQDVYQWTAPGAHGCQQGEGCIDLISDGNNPEKSEFVDASPDGSSVFIETDSSFDPRDPGLTDIYVAREGGGLPLPATVATCVGDSCQSVPLAPRDPTPSSASFRGAGDPVPKARKKARHRCQTQRRGKGKATKSKAGKRCKRGNRRATR